MPATFFVIGSEAARHPDIVRMLVRDGNELGNHTFTHVALSNGPVWQRRLQLDLTEAVIVGDHRPLHAARAPAVLGDSGRRDTHRRA